MAYPQAWSIRNREVERFVRFAVVGGVGTVVDFTILVVLKEVVGLPLLLANTTSYLAGVANNFTLNRLWTYPEARAKAVWRQFAQFLMVSTAGLILNNLIVSLLAEPLGDLLNMQDTGYIAAKVLATGIVVFWNFTANRLWTFNVSHA
jgi:putative flippase GtrA